LGIYGGKDMKRVVRCQAVILKENKILVLRQYNYNRNEEYWMLPGGGLEEEETNLEVEIKEVLFDEAEDGRDVYLRYVTFLCVPKPGSIEMLGSETVSYRKILELVWVPIKDEMQWNEYLLKNQFYPSMKSIKDRLIKLKEENSDL
jgi:ADP-ribose pyrophosphatase YjhB (NUDIX family)